jgi:hypothetical protein
MNSLLRRIVQLEGKVTDQSITAQTEAGQRFRIRRDSILPLAVAAFRRRHAEIEGMQQPVSPFDAKLDLLRAGARSSEPLLGVAIDVLRRSQEGAIDV